MAHLLLLMTRWKESLSNPRANRGFRLQLRHQLIEMNSTSRFSTMIQIKWKKWLDIYLSTGKESALLLSELRFESYYHANADDKLGYL